MTGPQLEPKKCSQHAAKLIENTFSYFPHINSYDFHNVPSLQAHNLNFEKYMAQTIQHKAATS